LTVRKVLFWLHLSAGVLAGVVILVMSLTGVALAFERQIVAAAERDLRSETGAGSPLPLSRLVARAAEAAGAEPSGVILRRDPAAPAEVAFGRGRTLFVDSVTGEVRGEGAVRLRRFFGFMEDAHRWLLLGGDARDRGKAVTGASNLAFLFIVLSGPFLWWPARSSRSAFRAVSWFRRGLCGRARDFNWHNVLGIWSFLPLIAIVFSGAVISYPWMSRLVYAAFGSTPPPPQQQRPAEGRGEGHRSGGLDPAAADRIWSEAIAAATQTMPEWRSLSVRLPLTSKGPVTFNVDAGNGARPDKRAQLLLDPRSGEVVEQKTYAAQQSGQKARAWLRWIHTGEAGGIAGQLVAMLASAAAVVLVWTGLALSLRRFARWTARRTNPLTEKENA
jgi:uncharacterized iron-regulated membrane protein